MAYFLANIKIFLHIFLISMLPISELRGAIPYGISQGINPFAVFIVSVSGNILIVPILLLITRPIIKFLSTISFMKSFSDFIMKKINYNSKKVLKYELWGLFLLVAIPLPGTGVWTASAVATFLDIRLKNSFKYISLGVVLAGIIVLILSYTGILLTR